MDLSLPPLVARHSYVTAVDLFHRADSKTTTNHHPPPMTLKLPYQDIKLGGGRVEQDGACEGKIGVHPSIWIGFMCMGTRKMLHALDREVTLSI